MSFSIFVPNSHNNCHIVSCTTDHRLFNSFTLLDVSSAFEGYVLFFLYFIDYLLLFYQKISFMDDFFKFVAFIESVLILTNNCPIFISISQQILRLWFFLTPHSMHGNILAFPEHRLPHLKWIAKKTFALSLKGLINPQ